MQSLKEKYGKIPRKKKITLDDFMDEKELDDFSGDDGMDDPPLDAKPIVVKVPYLPE